MTNIDGLTVKAETKVIYRCKYKGNNKTFQNKSAIIGWIAKIEMLPIFDKYNEKYGEVKKEVDWCNLGYVVSDVYEYWSDRKEIFISDMETQGIEYAKERLVKFFEEDYD